MTTDELRTSSDDPLAIPLREAPRTAAYLQHLRSLADSLRLVDPERYLALVDRGVTISAELGEYAMLADFLFSRSWCYRYPYGLPHENIIGARSDLLYIQTLLEDLPPERVERVCMRLNYHRGEIFSSEGRAEEARAQLSAGLERARELDDPNWQTAFHNSLASLHGLFFGDLQGQLDHLSSALRLCPRESEMNHTTLVNLARLSHYCDDYVTARAYLEEALAIEATTHRQRVGEYSLMSILCHEAGEVEEAAAWADRAVDSARHCGDDALDEALETRGAIHEWQHRYAAAVADLEEAINLPLSEGRHLSHVARLARAYASIAAGAEDAGGDAVAALSRARELLQKVESRLPSLPIPFRLPCLLQIGNLKPLLNDYRGAYEAIRELDQLRRSQRVDRVRSEIGSMRLLLRIERDEHERELQRMKAQQVERELGNTTMQLLAQTVLLRELRKDLLSMARKIPPGAPVARDLRERVKRLPCDSVDWNRFDMQFRAAHPDFVRNLLEAAPALTPTEVRICTMLRLNLKSHEIAGMFCISEDGVNFHRANIRRKLRLERDQKLPIVLGRM